MGIFNWNGAAGLPPLGDDENDQNASKRNDKRNTGEHPCRACGKPADAELAYCWDCTWMRLRHQQLQQQFQQPPVSREQLQQWPTTPQAAREQAQELERIRRQSAPLMTMGEPLDERCYWCCAIRNEHIAAPTGDKSVLALTPTIASSRDRSGRLVPGFECRRHQARHLAFDDTRASIVWMREEGVSTEEIAEYYRDGYLGGAGGDAA